MSLSDLNYLAVVVSAVAAFVASGAWYAGFGGQLEALSSTEHSKPMGSVVRVELVRNLSAASNR